MLSISISNITSSVKQIMYLLASFPLFVGLGRYLLSHRRGIDDMIRERAATLEMWDPALYLWKESPDTSGVHQLGASRWAD